MILGILYRASTQLRFQRFENHLDDEPLIGTRICRSLLNTQHLYLNNHFFHSVICVALHVKCNLGGPRHVFLPVHQSINKLLHLGPTTDLYMPYKGNAKETKSDQTIF